MKKCNIHVIPINDRKDHKEVGIDCHCNAKITNGMVIHRSYDRRENKEPNAITADKRID